MSVMSDQIISARKMGFRLPEDVSVWQGSFDRCWDFYVVPHAVEKDMREYRRTLQCEVYWMDVFVGNSRFVKIGVSASSDRRLKDQQKSFPIAGWSLRTCVNVNREKSPRCASKT